MATKAVMIAPTTEGSAIKTGQMSLDSLLADLMAPPGGRIELSVENSYDVVPMVYRCVQLISQAVGSIPFAITDKDGNKAEFEWSGQLKDWNTRLVGSMLLYGGGYLFKGYNTAKVLKSVAFVSFPTVDIHYDAKKPDGIAGYTRRVGEEDTTDIKPWEMMAVFIADPSVEAGPGRAPAQVAIQAASLMRAQNQFATSFFERSAIPATIVTVEGDPTDEDLDRLERWWKKLLQGAKSAWESVFLRAGINVHTVGQPVKDTAMPELMNMARAQVSMAFGVPEDMLSTGAANYATAKTHRVSFWRETVVPHAQTLEAALNKGLFNPLGLSFSFIFEAVESLQQDEATKADMVVKLVAAGIIDKEQAQALLGITKRVAEVDPADIEDAG